MGHFKSKLLVHLRVIPPASTPGPGAGGTARARERCLGEGGGEGCGNGKGGQEILDLENLPGPLSGWWFGT